MYRVIERQNVSDLYREVIDNFVYGGGATTSVPSRLGSTDEMQTVCTNLKPRRMIPFLRGRNANYFGLMAESLWVLSSLDNGKTMSTWNTRLLEYIDDEQILYGAYGRRIEMTLRAAIDKLREDINTRQAVVPIFLPADAGRATKDLPCNNMVYFKVRNMRLNMTVLNRSNDVIWGAFTVNFPQFALLQNFVASQVGVGLGEQTHVSDSMHLYYELKEQKNILDKIVKQGISVFDFYGYFNNYFNHNEDMYIMNTYNPHQINLLLRMWSEGTEVISKSDDYHDEHGWEYTPYLAYMEKLLTLYARYKQKRITAAYAVQELGFWLISQEHEALMVRCANLGVQVPLDLIYAAFHTLIRYSVKEEESAGDAVMYWFQLLDLMKLTNTPGSHLIQPKTTHSRIEFEVDGERQEYIA